MTALRRSWQLTPGLALRCRLAILVTLAWRELSDQLPQTRDPDDPLAPGRGLAYGIVLAGLVWLAILAGVWLAVGA